VINIISDNKKRLYEAALFFMEPALFLRSIIVALQYLQRQYCYFALQI